MTKLLSTLYQNWLESNILVEMICKRNVTSLKKKGIESTCKKSISGQYYDGNKKKRENDIAGEIPTYLLNKKLSEFGGENIVTMFVLKCPMCHYELNTENPISLISLYFKLCSFQFWVFSFAFDLRATPSESFKCALIFFFRKY